MHKGEGGCALSISCEVKGEALVVCLALCQAGRVHIFDNEEVQLNGTVCRMPVCRQPAQACADSCWVTGWSICIRAIELGKLNTQVAAT